MLHLLVIAVLVSVALVSLVRPWVGVVCAYLIVVLQPQAIWFWAFEGVRPEQWVLVPTGFGIVLGLFRREFDLSVLATKKNLFFIILWLCFALSYYFGQYTTVGGPYRFDSADTAFALTNKMMLLYFMATLTIDSEQRLKALYVVLCGSMIYLVYWANNQYFSGRLHGERLAGPTDVSGGGIYHDENAFAMLFVVAQALLWYAGLGLKKWWRWLLWLFVPFCWHAVFLTASRGGLVGLGVTTLLIALRSRRKLLAVALIPALIAAFVWQGGSQMHARADTIGAYEQDYSAEGRLQAWKAAARMIADHPLIGVGLASFGPAFPDYSTDRPREAHNTLLQITAESGVLAGIMYVLIVVSTITSLWAIGSRQKGRRADQADRLLHLVGEANLVGFVGLVSCAMFLSLQVFEIFYLLNVMANVIVNLERQRLRSDVGAEFVIAPALGSGAAEPSR